MHRLALLLPLLALASGCSDAWAAREDTARFASWASGEAFMRMNGSPIHRFTTTPDATTAESNLTATGGAAVAYTLFGGERLCFQTPEDAYVQVVAAASFAAGGDLAFTVGANEPLLANCFTTLPGELSVSTRCVSGSCTGIKAFETR